VNKEPPGKPERGPQEGTPKSLSSDLGNVLSRLLSERNVKQLAEEAGISRVEIYHIIAGRKKYAGLESLRSLARAMGMELSKMIALAEGKQSENFYFGEPEPEFTAQFKKQGILLSSDTPPNKDLFVGRLVLDPGVELSDRLTSDCLIFLRPTNANIEVSVGEQKRLLNVNQKALFNGKLPHRIKNPSQTSKVTCLFIATPSFWASNLTK